MIRTVEDNHSHITYFTPLKPGGRRGVGPALGGGTWSTTYPVSATTTLTLSGTMSGSWSIRVRIPAWTTGATITVNGTAQSVTAAPGSYATITRTWAAGDTITVRLPMRVIMKAANDKATVQAITYGPTVLSGNYGSTALSTLPSLIVSSIARTNSTSLAFTATANNQKVTVGPFYDAQGFNYTVYWNAQ